MNGNPNLLRNVSLGALFVLAAACFARADVTRLDAIPVDATRINGSYRIVTWPSSLTARTLSGCVGAYQAPMAGMVFHSVCQGLDLISESGRDEATMAFREPLLPIFSNGRAFESSFVIRKVSEMPLWRENWKFDVLRGISTPSGGISASSIYSGVGSRPAIFMTGSRSSGDEAVGLDLGEDMDHHPGKGKDHDGDDDLTPEPSTLLLLGTGTFILGAVLRRRLTTAA